MRDACDGANTSEKEASVVNQKISSNHRPTTSGQGKGTMSRGSRPSIKLHTLGNVRPSPLALPGGQTGTGSFVKSEVGLRVQLTDHWGPNLCRRQG